MAAEIYYYSKLYADIFDSTGWRLIMNEPYPTPAYASMIYFVILTESTSTEGVLMRTPEKAYTVEQLMALCRIRQTDDESVKAEWRKAFDRLCEEGIIDVDANGVIRVVCADEIFGSETEEAIRSRRRRKNRIGLKPQSDDDSRSECGQTAVACPPNDQERPLIDGQKAVNSRSGENPPLMNDESFLNSPESLEKRVEEPPVIRPSDAAAEFVRIYPKKTDASKVETAIKSLTEIELEALILAAEKIARDPSKTEQGGKFAKDPIAFIRSRPWTEEDLHAAKSILWGIRESKKLEEKEGGEADVD